MEFGVVCWLLVQDFDLVVDFEFWVVDDLGVVMVDWFVEKSFKSSGQRGGVGLWEVDVDDLEFCVGVGMGVFLVYCGVVNINCLNSKCSVKDCV